MVDLIVLSIIITFVLVGWRKGFGQYFLDLIIIAIGFGVGLRYYQQGHEILKSFLICTGVILSLSLLKGVFLREPRPRKSSPPFIDRILGVITGAIWGTSIVTLFIFGTGLLPLEQIFKYDIKGKVQSSKAHRIISRLIPIKKIEVIDKLDNMAKVSLNQEAIKKLSEQQEFKDLLELKQLQAIIKDPVTVNQLRNKDLQKLLANPKILKLLNDGQFIEELFKLDFEKALEEAEFSGGGEPGVRQEQDH